MTLGGLIVIALVVAIVPLCYKVREHSRKIRELEESTRKTVVKK